MLFFRIEFKYINNEWVPSPKITVYSQDHIYSSYILSFNVTSVGSYGIINIIKYQPGVYVGSGIFEVDLTAPGKHQIVGIAMPAFIEETMGNTERVNGNCSVSGSGGGNVISGSGYVVGLASSNRISLAFDTTNQTNPGGAAVTVKIGFTFTYISQ